MNRRRGSVCAATVFAVSLLYFFLTYRFYEPVQLRFRGVSPVALDFKLEFDFGTGYQPFAFIPVKVPAPVSPDGVFSQDVLLPQVKLYALRLSGAQDVISKLELGSVPAISSFGEDTINFSAPNYETRELPISQPRFRLGLFLLQVLLSAFFAWLAYLLVTKPFESERFSVRRLFEKVFIDEGRTFFWGIFLTASFVYSLWLLAYWPGATTNDSWSSLNEVLTFKFGDWHPYIYAIYLLILVQFFGVGGIALFQILATAAIGAWIFYFVWRNGVRWIYLLPFILLFVFSIPIGLFNLILWKDVPFSIAVWLFSFLLFRVEFRREAGKGLIQIPPWTILLWGLFLILLCHSRHNGKIFYFFVPLLLWGRIDRRMLAGLVAFLALSFATFNIAIPEHYGMKKITGSAYHEVRTALAIMTHHNFFSKDRLADQKVLEEYTEVKWERLDSLYPNKWFSISDLPAMVRHQFEAKNETNFNKKFLFRLIIENLPIFLTARTFDLLHSIGLDSSDYNADTNYFENPLQLQGNSLHPPGNFVYNVPVTARTPIPALTSLIEKIDSWSRQYQGLFSPLVAVWNLLIWFSLLILVLFLERGFSSIGLYTLPTFLVSAGIFVIGAGESWRYFYYVYLCGIFVIPLYLCFLTQKRRVRADNLRD